MSVSEDRGMFAPGERPATMTGEEFIALLRDLAMSIKAGDSMEGSLAYEWGDRHDEYRVSASLRIGNSMGQGGVRLINADTWKPRP